MLSDIALGRYIPIDSLIHKLDPRVKIFLTIFFIVLVFHVANYFALLLMLGYVFVCIMLSNIKIKNYFKGIKLVLPFILFTSILNLFYGLGEPVFEFYFIKITFNGINNSIFVALRLIGVILMGLILTYTTTYNNLAYAFEWIMKPLGVFKINVSEIAFMMMIALRFIPTLIDQADKIIDAQKSRGANFNSKNIFARFRAFVSILVPLFSSSFRRAYDLALAMECRCYTGADKRNRIKSLYIKRFDILFIVFTFCFYLGVFFCNWKIKSII